MSGPHGQNHILVIGFGAIAGALALMSAWTTSATPVRQARQVFDQLVASVAAKDVDDVRSLCSFNYLHDHPPEFDDEGHLIGLPREAGPGVKAYLQAGTVFISTGEPAGPTYRFVLEGYDWKFDGVMERARKTKPAKRNAKAENDSDSPG